MDPWRRRRRRGDRHRARGHPDLRRQRLAHGRSGWATDRRHDPVTRLVQLPRCSADPAVGRAQQVLRALHENRGPRVCRFRRPDLQSAQERRGLRRQHGAGLLDPGEQGRELLDRPLSAVLAAEHGAGRACRQSTGLQSEPDLRPLRRPGPDQLHGPEGLLGAVHHRGHQRAQGAEAMREATAPRRLRLPRVLCVGGATLVLAGALLSSVSTEARAAPATPTLTITPGAAGHPYASGQSINISVGPSSRFAAYSRIEILECAAPNGVLPVDDTSCDGNTAQYGSVLVASDGSFAVPAYTIYQLPNSALGEQANHAPKCDRSQGCVLYIGQDQNDFTQPKLFSAAFTVDPSTSPTPSPPAGPSGAGSTGAAAASTGAA